MGPFECGDELLHAVRRERTIVQVIQSMYCVEHRDFRLGIDLDVERLHTRPVHAGSDERCPGERCAGGLRIGCESSQHAERVSTGHHDLSRILRERGARVIAGSLYLPQRIGLPREGVADRCGVKGDFDHAVIFLWN